MKASMVVEPTTPSSLRRLLRPESVALVGASLSSRHGTAMVANLGTLGFGGEVLPVNPRHREVAGLPCYPSLRELPLVPDAVMIGVAGERAEAVLAEAAELGVGGAVVTAFGYAESGPDGQRAQDRLAALARSAGMALIGPNCMGFVNFAGRAALYLDPVEPYAAGTVSLLSQSGSVAIGLANNSRGVRWSHLVSSGNEAVTGSADLLAFAVDDPQTRILAVFAETIREPERFFAECQRARRAGKPVVVLKSGRTEGARRAALAHSGALAVADRLVDARLTRCGAIRVDTVEELLDTLVLLQAGRLPAGDGLAVVSESGGEIGLIHDELDSRSLRLPELSAATCERLSGYLPPGLPPSNPLDLWALPDAERNFERLLDDLAADPEVATVLATFQEAAGPIIPTDVDGHALRAARAVAARTEKPLALVAPIGGGADADLVPLMAEHGVAVLSGFRGALDAVERATAHARPQPPAAQPPPVEITCLDELLARFGDRPSAGHPALAFVAAAGIPTVPSMSVNELDEALAAAEQIGYPVVLKLGAPEILHKTELGGVVLDLRDAEALTSAFRTLRGTAAGPLLVQQQVTGGVELILGLHSEPGLGSFVMVGAGGVLAEVLDDVAIRPAALRSGEPEQMLAQLRAHPLLDGLRGSPRLHLEGVVDCIARLDAIAVALGDRIESLDLNPVVVGTDSVVALDAAVVPEGRR
jgi:acetate---CoA ligase (ADP-forming)